MKIYVGASDKLYSYARPEAIKLNIDTENTHSCESVTHSLIYLRRYNDIKYIVDTK